MQNTLQKTQIIDQFDLSVTISGVIVRRLRDKFKLSQSQAACEIGINRRTLQNIEYGIGGQDLCTAYKIAKYFNVTIESLIE